MSKYFPSSIVSDMIFDVSEPKFKDSKKEISSLGNCSLKGEPKEREWFFTSWRESSVGKDCRTTARRELFPELTRTSSSPLPNFLGNYLIPFSQDTGLEQWHQPAPWGQMCCTQSPSERQKHVSRNGHEMILWPNSSLCQIKAWESEVTCLRSDLQ
jgi:hypothetical protein